MTDQDCRDEEQLKWVCQPSVGNETIRSEGVTSILGISSHQLQEECDRHNQLEENNEQLIFLRTCNKCGCDGSANEMVTIATEDIIVEDVVATEEVETETSDGEKFSGIHYEIIYESSDRNKKIEDEYGHGNLRDSRRQVENGFHPWQRHEKQEKENGVNSVLDDQNSLGHCEQEHDCCLLEQCMKEEKRKRRVTSKDRNGFLDQVEKKRLRDREMKRVRRMDPQYREIEREKARELMQNKRANLLYRTLEREKDKERRRKARLKPEVREMEKLRDKLAKKESRRTKMKSKGQV